jgi:hypothetical protein
MQEPKKVREAIKTVMAHPNPGGIFLIMAISRGYSTLVTVLKDAPCISTEEEAAWVEKVGGRAPRHTGFINGPFLKPLELAAHEGQDLMFMELEHREDANYHRSMIEACENGCSRIADYILKKKPPVIDPNVYPYHNILDPGNREEDMAILILINRVKDSLTKMGLECPLDLKCPKCKNPLKFTVYLHIEAGLDSFHNLGKRAFRKASVTVSAALWDTTHFFCPSCGYSIDPAKRVRLVDGSPPK